MKKNKILPEFIQNLYTQFQASPTLLNISKVYVGDALTKVFTAGATLILIREMTQADYALYISFTAIAVFLLSLIGVGINRSLVRFSAEQFSISGEKPYLLYIFSVSAQLLVFLILFLFAAFFSESMGRLLFGKADLGYLLRVSALLGLANVLNISGQSMLDVEERFSAHVAALAIKQALIFTVVASFWLTQSLSFQRVAWGVTLIQLAVGVSIVVYGIVGVRGIDWRKEISREKPLIYSFLSASGWLIAYHAMLAGVSQMSIFMLSRFSSTTELANYGVAYQYYALALLLVGAISTVLTPKLSRIEMQDRLWQRQFYKKWIQRAVWIGVPIGILILFGKPFFVLLNGARYEGAFSVLEVLSIGAWISLMATPLINIMISRKDFRFLFALSCIALFASLGAGYIGVQAWGGVGAAVASVLVNNVTLQIPVLLRVYYD